MDTEDTIPGDFMPKIDAKKVFLSKNCPPSVEQLLMKMVLHRGKSLLLETEESPF